MSFERFESSDKRLVLVAALVTVVSVIYVAYNYRAAFPQASIELQYSKGEITRMAEDFLDRRGEGVLVGGFS